MKKLFLAFLILLSANALFAQSLSQTTIKRFSFGGDIFTDIWMNQPQGIKVRTINQGFNFFGMYNFPFGESNYSFAIGLGLGIHNMYSNSVIEDIKADTIRFVQIPDSVSYRKSKLCNAYIDLPLEIRLKTESKFRVAVGFKIGYLIDAKTKYKGNRADGPYVLTKQKQVNHVEKFRYGPVLRIGYDWFSFYGYFQISKIFVENRGPNNLYPISVGITLLPF
jgi:hypothetical protein